MGRIVNVKLIHFITAKFFSDRANSFSSCSFKYVNANSAPCSLHALSNAICDWFIIGDSYDKTFLPFMNITQTPLIFFTVSAMQIISQNAFSFQLAVPIKTPSHAFTSKIDSIFSTFTLPPYNNGAESLSQSLVNTSSISSKLAVNPYQSPKQAHTR